MNESIGSRKQAVAHVQEQLRRALNGDVPATEELHALAYLSDNDEVSEIARQALRVLGGPRADGRRPAPAGQTYQPWVEAVVDQLLARHSRAASLQAAFTAVDESASQACVGRAHPPHVDPLR